MKRVVSTAALALLLAFAANAAEKSRTLATVNGEPVTVADLKEQFVKRHGGHTKFLGGESEAKRFLNIVIDERLLLQEAWVLGLEELPAIREATDAHRIARAFDHLVKVEVEEKSTPTEEEILSAWRERTTNLYHVRQIIVDTEIEAEEVRAALMAGGDFERLARLCSIAASRIQGGYLGQIAWGTTENAEWEEIVFNLEVGDISPVIHTNEGWEVAQLLHRIETTSPDLDKAREKITSILTKRNKERREKELREYLWSRYSVELPFTDYSPSAVAALYARNPETLLAKWEGGSLTLNELMTIDQLRRLSQFAPGRAADSIEDQLRETVRNRLVTLESKARNLGEVPEVAEQVRKYQEELMLGALYADHVLKGVKVAEDEVRAYYAEKQGELVSPESRRVAHIAVSTREEAEAIRKQLSDGFPFEELAKEKSNDRQSAASGGDLGWITAVQTDGPFRVVMKMALDEVSEPLESKVGWHLVKVTEIRPAEQHSFEEASERIRQLLLEKKKKDARALWVQKLRQVAKIRIDDKAIRRYVKENPFEDAPAPEMRGGPPGHATAPARSHGH